MELKKREEVIKALECCINHEGDNCPDCPYHYTVDGFNQNCKEDMCTDALALIKELTEEIKDLEADYDRVYEQVEADIRGNMADGGTSCHWCIDGHRRDAIKQMQEKLSLHFGTYTDNDTVKVRDVFKLVGKFAEELLEGKR